MKANKLKDCPFCGISTKINKQYTPFGFGLTLGCTSCNYYFFEYIKSDYNTQDEKIKDIENKGEILRSRWNIREDKSKVRTKDNKIPCPHCLFLNEWGKDVINKVCPQCEKIIHKEF